MDHLHQQPGAVMRGRSLSSASNRSPSLGAQDAHHIRQSHSPSPSPFLNQPPSSHGASSPASIGLGIGIDQSTQPDFAYNSAVDPTGFQNQRPFHQQHQGITDPAAFQPTQDFPQSPPSQGTYSQALLDPTYSNTDFSLFPPTSSEQYNAPLFGTADPANMMASSQAHHSPTPPHLLKPDPHQPGSAHNSPSFNQSQFSSPPGRHSRNASLGPEAALMSSWSNGPQFQGHRRTPSEYSDVSSAAPSPNLVSQDSFENVEGPSPMMRPQDPNMYPELAGMGNFTISDQGPNRARSPSHSPAISPRILPAQSPDMNQQGGFMLSPQNNGYPYNVPQSGAEAFPQLPSQSAPPDVSGLSQITAPTINIDYAPNASQGGLKAPMDQDALTPPENRGRPRSRPRAVTDPYNSGGMLQRPVGTPGSLSPSLSSDLGHDSPSRSLSPLDRQPASSPSGSQRRRHSSATVPNNVIALRLADPQYQAETDATGGPGSKRVQKHPATFQCTLCPKRFTRAYNLRSHLRTHTDERPFVCTVCGKAFARQHDRKRHEGLHSGEKKFVCKGDLKAGGQWGCGRRFARADALGRHFRSEAGRICIKPLLDEEMLERQRLWNEQRMAQAQAQGMAMQQMGMQGQMMPPSMEYPGMDNGQYGLPAALLAQYPALAQMNWGPQDMGGAGSGMEDDLSGRSSFEASDYDDGNDDGYVSGPGTGFGPGSMGEGYGELGYASDYGGR